MAGGLSGRKEGKGKKGNGGGFEWGINCLHWRARRGEKGRGEGGARRILRGCGGGPASRGKKKGRGKRRLTGGPRLSAPRGKKKKGRGRGGLAREVGWAAWAEREPVRVFFLFFSFFQTPFSNQIHFKFKSNLSNFFPRIL
jgi:hypothetical protein